MSGVVMAPQSRESEGVARDQAVSTDVPVYVASGLSLAVALIHFWAMPEHMLEWWGYGVFFLAVALAQGFFAVALMRWPGAPLCVGGVLFNVAIVAMYVVTRTSGIPLGPQAAMIEDPGILDMTATVLEVGIIFALVTMLGDVLRRRMVNALFLLGAAVWALKFAGILY